MLTNRDLAKLLLESNQEIPECLQQYKPDIPPEAPLFDDDDDDDDDDDEDEVNDAVALQVPSDSGGAAWDAGDNSAEIAGGTLQPEVTSTNM
jgi:hypothetical protein